jgi:hypothetical protein
MQKMPKPTGYTSYYGTAGNTENLEGHYVSGNCCAPDILHGDLLIVDPTLRPEVGNYVIYGNIVYKFLQGKDGSPLLINGHSRVKPEADIYGVIIETQRRLKNERPYQE